jgi:hypothetical protein
MGAENELGWRRKKRAAEMLRVEGKHQREAPGEHMARFPLVAATRTHPSHDEQRSPAREQSVWPMLWLARVCAGAGEGDEMGGRHRMIALLIKSPPFWPTCTRPYLALASPRPPRSNPINRIFPPFPFPPSLSSTHHRPSSPVSSLSFLSPLRNPFSPFFSPPFLPFPSTISRPLETNWSQAACHSNQTLSRSLRLNRYTTIVSKSPAVVDQSLPPPPPFLCRRRLLVRSCCSIPLSRPHSSSRTLGRRPVMLDSSLIALNPSQSLVPVISSPPTLLPLS